MTYLNYYDVSFSLSQYSWRVIRVKIIWIRIYEWEYWIGYSHNWMYSLCAGTYWTWFHSHNERLPSNEDSTVHTFCVMAESLPCNACHVFYSICLFSSIFPNRGMTLQLILCHTILYLKCTKEQGQYRLYCNNINNDYDVSVRRT